MIGAGRPGFGDSSHIAQFTTQSWVAPLGAPLWDEGNYLAEAGADNVIQAAFTNDPRQYGSVISTRIGATTFWHQFDALGSTVGISDFEGDGLPDTWIYDAWGNIVSRTGTNQLAILWIGEVENGATHDWGRPTRLRRQLPYRPVYHAKPGGPVGRP